MTPKQKTIALWAGAAFILTCFMVFNNSSHNVRSAGFFAKTFAILLGTVFGAGGAMIGDAIRRFTQPDSIYTNGGMGSILKAKLFWKFGPQLIGLLFGCLLGGAIGVM